MYFFLVSDQFIMETRIVAQYGMFRTNSLPLQSSCLRKHTKIPDSSTNQSSNCDD